VGAASERGRLGAWDAASALVALSRIANHWEFVMARFESVTLHHSL